MATSVDAKLLKSTKFPLEFNQKVDMQKVNLEVMKRWIAGKISSILGNEDDVVIELCFNLIEGARYPDIKKLQIQLTGFLEKDTAAFCKELWKLCLSAQSNPQGVPKELLEAKKLELIQEKIDAEKAADETRRRREIEQRREREIDSIRNRERGDRGRGGRGDSWRSGRNDRGNLDRGGRDFDRRGSRRSRSPAPRRRDSRERGSFRGPPPPRDIDTYVPTGRSNRRRDEPRRRSPSESLSPRHAVPRSRSPPRRRRRSDSESPSPHARRRTPSPDRYRGGYRGRGGRGRGRSLDRGHRRRSYTPSDNSRSPSLPTRKRRRSPSKSLSLSPPPRSWHRSRRNTSSISRSRSSSHHSSRDRMASRRARNAVSPRPDNKDIIRTGVSARKGRNRDERRLTRSNSRDPSLTPQRYRRKPSRSRSISGGERERKRRRSLQRYAPVSRRCNTSSVSSPTETRDRRADSSEDEGARRSPAREINSKSSIHDEDMTRTTDPQEVMSLDRQANELREKLLREKIKKMRTMSASSSNTQTNHI